MSGDTWKRTLQAEMDAGWSEEIDQFESQMSLRKQAKLDEKLSEYKKQTEILAQKAGKDKKSHLLAAATTSLFFRQKTALGIRQLTRSRIHSN